MDVSIIVTTYNAEKFILSTLDSIKKQTHSHYEVIIVDDGSTDGTLARINQFIALGHAQKYKLFSRERLGRAKALQFAVLKADYDWVAILDADDLWHCQKLEVQVNYIKRFQLSFLATKSLLFEKDIDINLLSSINTLPDINRIKKVSFNTMLCHNRISHVSVLFKKNLANYDSSRTSQLDYELWLRLLQQKVPLFILDINLVFHRIHNKQFFEAQNRLRYTFNTTWLQLRFCIKNYRTWPIFFIMARALSYALINRKFKIQFEKMKRIL